MSESMSVSKQFQVFGQVVRPGEAALLLLVLMFFTYRVFFRNKMDLGATSRHMSDTLPGDIRKIPTEWGDIYIRVFDPEKSGLEKKNGSEGVNEAPPVVCLPGINAKLVDEWVPVADALHKKGHYVIIINFHSNPNTTPALFYGGFTDDNVQTLLRESIMKGYFGGRHKELILFGKSWGGKQAMQFAATSPKLVNKLCLVAPASTDADMIASLGNPIHAPSSKWTQPADNYLPILLAWAKDDRALWFSNSKVWTDTLKSNQLKLITAETGGHRILPEYLEGIISFLTK